MVVQVSAFPKIFLDGTMVQPRSRTMVGEGGFFFSGPCSSSGIHYLFTALCQGHTEQPLPYQSSFLMGRNLELALDIAMSSSPQK